MYYIFVENGEIFGRGQARIVNPEVESIEVSQEVYDNYKMYIYQDGEIILDPDYEEKQEQRRREMFEKKFFNTSLGWVRREVNMANGEIKDFLSDLLPSIFIGVSSGTQVTVLTYDAPDFTQEIYVETEDGDIIDNVDWPSLQHVQVVTPQFLQECLAQLQNDFIPAN